MISDRRRLGLAFFLSLVSCALFLVLLGMFWPVSHPPVQTPLLVSLLPPPARPKPQPKIPKPKPPTRFLGTHKSVLPAPSKPTRAHSPVKSVMQPIHLHRAAVKHPVLRHLLAEKPVRAAPVLPRPIVIRPALTTPVAKAPQVTPPASQPETSPAPKPEAPAPGAGETAGTLGEGTDQGTDSAASGAGTGNGETGDGNGGGGGVFGIGEGSGTGAQHIVYVLDVSPSMVSRIARARQELRSALATLPHSATFDIIAFGGSTLTFSPTPVAASPSLIAQADQFLDDVDFRPGTNLEAAMTEALAMPNIEEVVVLTDGVPTQGETNFKKLARLIRRRNTSHARIDTIGLVGKNPDGSDDSFAATQLLQQIADDSGGQSRLVSLGTTSP